MRNTKKIVKDPMFIGAASGFAFVVLPILWSLLSEVIHEVYAFLFAFTYPIKVFVPVFLILRRLRINPYYAYVPTMILWYIQCGFFGGLLYRFLRKKHSRLLCMAVLLLMAAAIVAIINLFNLHPEGTRLPLWIRY